MNGDMYSTVTLAQWNDYKRFTADLSDNWAFRGQMNPKWELMNAIERTEFIHLYKGIEADFVAEFQRGARNYLNHDEIPTHLIEWLALMQHHGAPTRLLDFSKSPFIAAFFAFEQCTINEASQTAIWAINMGFLKSRAAEVIASKFSSDMEQSNHLVNEALFTKIFYENSGSYIFPVEPFRMNRRYSLQQSIFVSTANSYEPFMQQLHFLGSEISKAVIKIELPSALQKEVIRDLQRMNLNRASLFPDLDGYAASLRLRYNSMRTSEENLAYQLSKMEDPDFPFLP